MVRQGVEYQWTISRLRQLIYIFALRAAASDHASAGMKNGLGDWTQLGNENALEDRNVSVSRGNSTCTGKTGISEMFKKVPIPAVKSSANPNGMDFECISLCKALSKMAGITTIESCCGHGSKPYRIWFLARSLKDLPIVLYYFDVCHSGRRGWQVIVRTDCGMSPAKFMIEGPIGQVAYEDSEHIAKLLRR